MREGADEREMAFEFLDADVDAGSEVGEEKADGRVAKTNLEEVGGRTEKPGTKQGSSGFALAGVGEEK